MSEMDGLLDRVAATIATYRQGEIDAPTREHVRRWLQQFTPQNQLPFLREFSSVIDKTFCTKDWLVDFLGNLSGNPALSGPNPAQFWAGANILRIQTAGRSQREMVGLLGVSLLQRYGLDVGRCGSEGGDYIYLDDAIFTGSRATADISSWIRGAAPPQAKLHIIVVALHAGGFYWSRDKLQLAAREAGKNLQITYWRAGSIENRRTYKNVSNVLWPAVVPDSSQVSGYLESISERYPLELRNPGATCWPFSSEEGRQLLESEFLLAGVGIKANIVDDKSYFRPLGFGQFGAGFGSLISTYRNCPNNAPLALWWGDGGQSSPALNWYPLLKRRTNLSFENMLDELS